MKKGILCIIVLSLLCSNVYAGEKELKEKLKHLLEEEEKGQKINADDLRRGELYDFLNKNQKVPLKNFSKFRLAVKASGFVIRDLNRKYGITDGKYLEKITDKEDRFVYQTALRTLDKQEYKTYYLCKGEDERKVKDSYEKVSKIKKQISELAKKNKNFDNSDEEIGLREEILEECRFDFTAFGLLKVYRFRGDEDDKYRKKFNELMFKMIADDQLNYDYLYEGLDSLEGMFSINYGYLLHYVNSEHNKFILTKDQVKFIAENVLDKHWVLFDMRRFYSNKTGMYDEYVVRDNIQSMVNLSNWLRHYQLDDLNEKLIKRFFDDQFVMTVLREEKWFHEYRDYLLKRMDFQKYKDR